MIDQELLARLDQWHEENQHKKILQEVQGLPEEIQKEYEIQGRLARALNNLGKYNEAIQVLESTREAGAQDDRWWSRMGFALYHQNRNNEARKCFLRAQELNPENHDAKNFLIWLGVSTNGIVKNDKKEKPDHKPRLQAIQKPNGWEDRTEAPRLVKPKEEETANGWEQKKAPAQAKPQAGGNGNDWEGRGWEGTALLETALFGVLRFPVKEGLFQTFPLPLRGKSRMVDLFIWDGLAQPPRWEAIQSLLNAIPELYQKARARIEADHGSNQVIEFFIRDQVEEMDEDALTGALGVQRREEITPERFLDALEPRGITLAPAKDGGIDCIFDFSLDPEITDELLVIRFGQNQEITDICHES
ncbi:MAG: DUF2004 domain-containing protein [Angelakisella sp.]|jgi:tetratricopeptide (TPR) repeat protein|nr:DUF2004 domain-containing protein [Angelakisella sp.]